MILENRKNSSRGFTLIELLVVIAIIGILSSVVLASLSTARSKGNDAKVKEQLSSARSAAEIYYNGKGNYTYSSSGNCISGMFADTASGMSGIFFASSSWPAGSYPFCFSSTNSYVILAPLTGSGGYMCIDSVGNATTTFNASNPGASLTAGKCQ